MNKLNLNGQSFVQNKDYSWSHDPEQSSLLLKAENPKKKDGTLKAKYKDLPRYKLIVDYENHYRSEFRKTMSELNKEVFTFLKENI